MISDESRILLSDDTEIKTFNEKVYPPLCHKVIDSVFDRKVVRVINDNVLRD